MRVDLRRRDVHVTQQLLHDPKIGAAGEQVRREAVAEHVRVDVTEAHVAGVASDDLPDRDPLERSPGVGQEQPAPITLIVPA